jgi:hypothetical protein
LGPLLTIAIGCSIGGILAYGWYLGLDTSKKHIATLRANEPRTSSGNTEYSRQSPAASTSVTTENHGTTDKLEVKAERHGASDTPTAEVKHLTPNATKEQTPRLSASANWLAAIKTPPTISDVFQNDFPNTMKLTDEAVGIQWKDTGAVTHIKRQLYLDFPANSKFVGFYIPTSDPSDLSRTAEICLMLAKADAVQQALDELPKTTFIAANLGQTTTIQDLTFSGRVVIYHDDFLSITQQADIIRAFAEKHYALGFFGPNDFGKTLSEWHRLHDDATRVQQ